MAFLLLLERLSPVERAVFLLHDVFDYGYDEIARIVGKSEDNCRQLAVRARRHVGEHRPRFEASRRKREELAARFFGAVRRRRPGRPGRDCWRRTSWSTATAAGPSPSWPRPIVGRDHVVRLLLGIGQQIRQAGISIQPAEVNGQPGAMFLDPDGQLSACSCWTSPTGRCRRSAR